MICLSTTAASDAQLLADVDTHRAWIDSVELRVDLLSEEFRTGISSLVRKLRERLDSALLICTVRRKRDGGQFDGPEDDRFRLLEQCVRAGADCIDLEIDVDSEATARLVAQCGERGVRVIWSLHDFDGVPRGLSETLDSMVRSSGGIAKVAVTPKSTGDLLRVLEAADSSTATDRIVVGMGPFGTLTRVAPKRFGSLLSFCSVPGRSAAPGHLSPQELALTYRVREQKASWPLFAVAGNPVAHSKSPHYHNRRFAESGTDALYVPILVDEFQALMDLAEKLPLHGMSVTIPHKRSALEAAVSASSGARASGAANTLVRSGSSWEANNSDVSGFLKPIEALGAPLKERPVLVLGAGGASRGVVYGLAESGASVYVWNRTVERAAALCRDLAAIGKWRSPPRVFSRETEAPQTYSLIVNTTSVGMHGEGDPAPWLTFTGSELVYDIVYTPPDTPFIRRAREAGCRVVTGDQMFDAQAEVQSQLFVRMVNGHRPGD